ncbi:MAG: LacI family DNA-binding transcriptional regulator [Anaerolineales bacterium]
MSASRPTIRDVARLANVSHQTVSRVINGSDSVAPETRRGIEAAIRELGYRPNAIARSMARGETRTLACIAPNLTDYTFASIIEGAERQARARGYYLLSSSASDERAFGALIEKLAGHRRVDGLLVINPYADTRHQMLPPDFPVVFVGAHARGGAFSSVALDDQDVARNATRHLIETGCRRIALITGPMDEDCSVNRLEGFRQALAQAGLPYDESLLWEGDWSASSGRTALLKMAENGHLPDGVFAQNDRMALGVLRAARELKLRIPEELAVIGVDDMPLASYFDPPLTTMRQDMQQIGRRAADLLLKTINGEQTSPENILVPAELVVRESTRQA